MRFYFIFLYIASAIFFLFYNNEQKINNYRVFHLDSLCGSFINEIAYKLDRNVCHLPCKINTTLNIISVQSDSFCSRAPLCISFNKNYLTALSNVTIKQHYVVNRTYYIYHKKLLVYLP